MDLELGKRIAAEKAATLIEDGMIVGLGTGSTASYFIQALIVRFQKGLRIQTVASSHRSSEMAKAKGLLVFDINQVSHIDITVDGADEIDEKKRMIKGGGGAHVREKILASSSKKMIVIVDESKLVKTIGKAKLPIEILPYGSLFTQKKIKSLGFLGTFRENFITENGNLIFDLIFPSPPGNPEQIEQQLLNIPGVVDTGFFFNMADTVIIGKSDGTVISI